LTHDKIAMVSPLFNMAAKFKMADLKLSSFLTSFNTVEIRERKTLLVLSFTEFAKVKQMNFQKTAILKNGKNSKVKFDKTSKNLLKNVQGVEIRLK
jgi:hypothetical protein